MNQLPDLTPEDLAKVERLKNVYKDTTNVNRELYILAEVGYYFGWEAILSYERDEIGLDRVIELLEAVRKVNYTKLYDEALSNFYANKDGKTFIKGMQDLIKKMEVKD